MRGSVSIHQHRSFLCFSVTYMFLSELQSGVLSKEMMRLKSAHCEFSSLLHVLGGVERLIRN